MVVAAGVRLDRQNEFRILIADDHAAGDLAQPDLGTAQILQHRELSPGLGTDPPDHLEHGGVLLVRAVREVEAENVDPRLDHMLSRRSGRSTPARSSPRSSSALFQIALYVSISSKSRFGISRF